MTSNSQWRARVMQAALLVSLAAGAIALQIVRERRVPNEAVGSSLLYVTSPAAITRMALSFDAVLADIYWIRAIQYYGSTRLSESTTRRYDLLYPLLDLTTALDPHFRIAYRFGSFFLAERAPGGAGRPDLAVALLEKGMAAEPDRWEYLHDTGFVYYRNGDFVKAADWFSRAGDIPGAPTWLKPLAAVTLSTGGDIESSRVLWRNLLAESDEDWLKRAAAFRLQQLDTVETIRQLERVVAVYARRHGGPAVSWADLIRDGLLRGVPLDAAGEPLVLEPPAPANPDGLSRPRITVQPTSPMQPLPTEGAR